MKEVIDINKLSLSNDSTIWENRNSINRRLVSKIIQLSIKYQFKKFKANSKVVSMLSDTSNYIVQPINTTLSHTNELIHYGKLSNIDIYLDSNMQWGDDRIIPMYDESLMRSYKICKIRGKELKFDMLEELKIENIDF